jgi:hypothetical protein
MDPLGKADQCRLCGHLGDIVGRIALLLQNPAHRIGPVDREVPRAIIWLRRVLRTGRLPGDGYAIWSGLQWPGDRLNKLAGPLPDGAKEAIGHGLRAKRSKSGAIGFDLLSTSAADGPARAGRREGLGHGAERLFRHASLATGSRSCARPWGGMRSLRCTPLRSIRPPGSSILLPF